MTCCACIRFDIVLTLQTPAQAGVHLTSTISIAVQVGFVAIYFMIKLSLQIFAHTTSTRDSFHQISIKRKNRQQNELENRDICSC